MKSLLLVLLGLVIGGAAGFFVATPIGAGVGIATGLKAGACLTVEGAKEAGFITSEQVDDVLMSAGRQIASADVAEDVSFSGGDTECTRFIAEMKQAASQ